MSERVDRHGNGSSLQRQMRVGMLLKGGLAALLIGGVIAAASLASAGGWWGGHRHWGRHGGADDPEAAREHAARAVEWVFDWVDADDEQVAQAQALVAASVDELRTMGATHREHREALIVELAQPQIDRDAVEEIRRAELALAETASLRLTDTLVDVAEVLTPEQRLELIEIAERFHH